MTREAKLKELKEHPERHRHTFGELQRCCMHAGALDTQIMDAHATHASVGANGRDVNAKLEEHEPAQIRWLRSLGYRRRPVAAFFDISVEMVSLISNNHV